MGKLTSVKTLAIFIAQCPQRWKLIALFLVGLFLLSCSGWPLREAGPRGVYHRVRSGESLSAIARAYNVDLQELAEINNIRHPDRINADSVIFIPDVTHIPDEIMVAAGQREQSSFKSGGKQEIIGAPASRTGIARSDAASHGKQQVNPQTDEAPSKQRQSPLQAAEREAPSRKSAGTQEGMESQTSTGRTGGGGEKPEQQIKFEEKRFIWPVKGTVISPFGIQPNRLYFNGIRIAAAQGTPIQAAADGLVIFSAPLKDYGETIIIQHEDHYATVYAHLGSRTVQGEARVRKGGRIAFVGKAGEKGESSLHFEIRHNNRARNPLFFLP